MRIYKKCETTKSMKRFLFLTILLSTLFFAVPAFAVDTPDPTKVELENPMGAGRTDVRAILGDIIKYAMGILGSLTLLVFVYGGFLWLISAGSDERVKKGSQTMLWAVIGIFIIFASYGILTLVFNAIGAKKNADEPWGVQGSIGGYTNKQATEANESCYCFKKDLITQEKSLCREETFLFDKDNCSGSHQKEGLMDCEWQTFQTCAPDIEPQKQ